MWIVYTLLIIGALTSVVNTCLLIGLALLAVRVMEERDARRRRQRRSPRRKRRRRGQMLEGDGLVDVDTPQVTYDMPREIVQQPPQS
jgi:hypothetical protein